MGYVIDISANKYRDRAAERRDGKSQEDVADLPGGFLSDRYPTIFTFLSDFYGWNLKILKLKF